MKPTGAVAWLAYPIPADALAALQRALTFTYGEGLMVEMGDGGMWLTRTGVREERQADPTG